MAYRQNYGLQRAERNRLKQAKKEAKIQELRDAVLRRRTEENEADAMDVQTVEPDAHVANGDAKEGGAS